MAKRSLPRGRPAPGTPDDGDDFMNCPVCGLVFDCRDLGQLMEHAHGRPPTEWNKDKEWTEEAIDDLRDMLAAGDSIDEVAEFLCRPVEEARAKATELKLLPGRPN
jgi:hypothetical protein